MGNRFADNQAVLKALGLDHLKRVTAINIRLRVDQLPTVVVWQHLDQQHFDIQPFVAPTVQRFHLIPVEETQPGKADL